MPVLCRFAFQCAAVLVCLSTCGHCRGNGARLREMADSRVLATTRHIHICLRVAVLRDSSHFRRFRPAAAPTVAALGTSGRVRRGARGLGLTPAPCAAAPVVFVAIRAAMLRRRNTGFSPCDVSHRASDEPRRRMSLSSALAPSSLASPSTRRVSFRSFCARRRSVGSLNLARVSPGAKRSRRRRAQCGVQICRAGDGVWNGRKARCLV